MQIDHRHLDIYYEIYQESCRLIYTTHEQTHAKCIFRCRSSSIVFFCCSFLFEQNVSDLMPKHRSYFTFDDCSILSKHFFFKTQLIHFIYKGCCSLQCAIMVDIFLVYNKFVFFSLNRIIVKKNK